MKRFSILILAAIVAVTGCRQQAFTPRPTLPLVLSLAADTSSARLAGHGGSEGSIAIIGEPSDALILARRFLAQDSKDNIDGRSQRDSLPDFAGESFSVVLDANNAPYAHFLDASTDESRPDSLREAAVRHAVFAWGGSRQSKVLVFTSPMQAVYGLFDVDTLQQLTGGRSHLYSPVKIMLADAVASGASDVAVWASREVRSAKIYEQVFEEMGEPGHLTVITPDQALDSRTSLRSLLRQYRSTGLKLDALVLDSFSLDPLPLRSEFAMIRQGATEEDQAFARMLSPDFVIIDPCTSVVSATYDLLRSENLFTHHIHRPVVHYYETRESATGELSYQEVNAQYANHAYVQDFD